ncbi:MAG: hypothetical protein WC026_13330 [Hyphomicrobium sp.]|uniref:hypothetical protein n=1 Tax=Hyphomicrobium sp. TaxID=82 RepID=UPI003563F631
MIGKLIKLNGLYAVTGDNNHETLPFAHTTRQITEMIVERFGLEYAEIDDCWQIEYEIIEGGFRQLCSCYCHINSGVKHIVACCKDGYVGEIYNQPKINKIYEG